jgi:stage IV sporulation protein FB
MPFGAVVRGDIDGLKFADEIKIAIAGPLINLAIGMLFVAFWWIYPESYAFTDIIAEANFAMAIVNLLPIYPLDGGRIFSASLACKFGSEKAFKISKIIGGIFALGLLLCFIATLFYQANLSLLFFSLFVGFGAFGRSKENKYVKIYTALSEQSLMRGMSVKKHALSKNATVKKLISMIDETAVNEVSVFDGDGEIALLKQNKINKIIENGDVYSPISRYLI